MPRWADKTVMHDFVPINPEAHRNVCKECGGNPVYREHYHGFTPTRMKALCACGYGPKAECHQDPAVVVMVPREKVKLEQEQAARSHDADIIMGFKNWISKLGDDPIAKRDLMKYIDRYATAIELGVDPRR